MPKQPDGCLRGWQIQNWRAGYVDFVGRRSDCACQSSGIAASRSLSVPVSDSVTMFALSVNADESIGRYVAVHFEQRELAGQVTDC